MRPTEKFSTVQGMKLTSCLFRKLSRKEKHFSPTECHLSSTQQCNSTLITTITKILQQKRKKKKNLPELNTLVNLSHIFLNWQRAGAGEHCCTVWQETKLNHVSTKTGTLNCNSCPGSIQCERTSFLSVFRGGFRLQIEIVTSIYKVLLNLAKFLWKSIKITTLLGQASLSLATLCSISTLQFNFHLKEKDQGDIFSSSKFRGRLKRSTEWK